MSQDFELDPQSAADSEVWAWTHRRDINGTVSMTAAATIASWYTDGTTHALSAMLTSYYGTGDLLAWLCVTDAEVAIREIEAIRRKIFHSATTPPDEKEFCCTELDALQTWIEVHSGIRARV